MAAANSNLPAFSKDKLHKPAVFSVNEKEAQVGPGIKFHKVLPLLQSGKKTCFIGTYGFAMSFYAWLKKKTKEKYPVHDYASYRMFRSQLQKLCAHFLVIVKAHKLQLAKAPETPWLRDFYPDKEEFLMCFTDILGMNGAYQWYVQGIDFPGLKGRVHPYYGAYFPTRFSHLQLFDKWLASQKSFKRALDIGCGCGVLSLFLHKHKVAHIHATDINPNAVYSTASEIQRRGLSNMITVEHASFSGSFQPQSHDLIVFNPPWLPAPPSSSLDRSTYYDNDFFKDFFNHIHHKFNKEALLVMLFSNFAEVAGLSQSNPIAEEIEKNKRFSLLEKIEAGTALRPKKNKDWMHNIRSKEKVSLWVLKKE